jgi:hypothetical protein
MNRLLWNFAQIARETIGAKPLGCPARGCECKAGDIFACECCNRIQPFCRGMDDDYFALCDDCWMIAHKLHETAGIPLGEEVR